MIRFGLIRLRPVQVILPSGNARQIGAGKKPAPGLFKE
jgi:hypothetical protein